MEIPASIVQKAKDIESWFKKRGIEGWQFCGLSERNLCSSLEAACVDYQKQLEAFQKTSQKFQQMWLGEVARRWSEAKSQNCETYRVWANDYDGRLDNGEKVPIYSVQPGVFENGVPIGYIKCHRWNDVASAWGDNLFEFSTETY